MHLGDPRWKRPPALFGNAIDRFGVARAQGFVVSGLPAPGEMVVYGSSYGGFGHIATVVAVAPDRYEVIEQNFLDFDPELEGHWATFDLRSVAWPDAAVVGFVVAPGPWEPCPLCLRRQPCRLLLADRNRDCALRPD